VANLQTSSERPFWERKKLTEMTPEEWESLCDGCGRCCLKKFEHPRTHGVVYTDVACRLLDCERGRCKSYASRAQLVPDCVVLDPEQLERLRWLPSTCAYRRLADGKPLEWWHPLVSGDPRTVQQAGISIRGRALSEASLTPREIEERVVSWVKPARPTRKRKK
jgi:uncharacterized cysteine cluster protein YcgN (CxxCxxCC family)